MQQYALYYFIITNTLTFSIFLLDKWKAINHGWRIRENTMLILSAIGGLGGGWFAMFLVRHKIKDVTFLPKMILITLIWIIGIIVFLKK